MNFLEKNKTIIIIIGIILFCILIGFVLNKKIPKMNKTLPNSKTSLNNNNQQTNEHQTLDAHSTTNKPSNEPEVSTSKKPITQADYDQIKSYILSENSNAVLSLNNLSPEDRVKINNIKQELINDLEHSKNYFQPQIDEFQNKCDEYTSQINEIVNQIPSLKKRQREKEAELATTNAKIDKLKLKKQNKTTQLQTQGLSIYQNNDLTTIQAEIYQLQDERVALVTEIDNIKIQIGKLASNQEMYEDMLSRAQNYKKDLEKDLNKRLEQNKQSALSSLNSLYEITSAEG